MAHRKTAVTEILEGVRTCHLVNEVKADKNLVMAARHRTHDVTVKDLLVQ